MQFDKAKIRYSSKDGEQNNKAARVSTYSESYKGEYYNIAVERLIPFRNQARHFFDTDSINSMAETVKEHGIRQPLTVIPSEIKEGYFEVVSGERRLRAAKVVGLARVPCIIIHDIKKAEEIAIIENIQRKDLHPVELMRAYKNLLEQGICNSTQEIASKIGIAKSSVVETLNLDVLPLELQTLLIENNVKNRDFFRVLCKTDPSKYHTIIEEHIKTKIEISTKRKRSSLQKKASIISIVLEGDELYIAQNKSVCLTKEKKILLTELLTKLLEETK